MASTAHRDSEHTKTEGSTAGPNQLADGSQTRSYRQKSICLVNHHRLCYSTFHAAMRALVTALVMLFIVDRPDPFGHSGNDPPFLKIDSNRFAP